MQIEGIALGFGERSALVEKWIDQQLVAGK